MNTLQKALKITQYFRYTALVLSCIAAYIWFMLPFPLCLFGAPFLFLAVFSAYDIIKHRNHKQDYTIRVGRLEIVWYPGSWCRPGEWVFSNDKSCDVGCIILHCGFFVVSWLSKEHLHVEL